MEAQGFPELNRTLGELLGRTENTLAGYREIAPMLVSSIQENFRQGGRPDRWFESRRARKEAGQTLLQSGRLMKSVTVPNVTADGIEFGSNLPYAQIHQEGGEIHFAARSETFKRNRIVDSADTFSGAGRFKKGTTPGRGFTRKAYSVRMPARPFIVFQDEDVEAARQIMIRHLLGAK